MRLFLDTSVLLAAAGSAKGASRFLVTGTAGRAAATAWIKEITPRVRLVRTSVSLDKPLVLAKAKDRPVVITALAARAAWLLTLDEADFHRKLGRVVYGLRLATPGEFLLEQRALGLL